MESAVAEQGATPATTAVVQGAIHVGLTNLEMQTLAEATSNRKVGVRDFATAALEGANGGTTVAATMFASTSSESTCLPQAESGECIGRVRSTFRLTSSPCRTH